MAKILKSWMMAGQALSYSKAVQVSIHSLTLINVLHFVLRWVGEGRLLDGGKYLLAFLVWTGFVLYQSLHMMGGTRVAAARPMAKVPAKAPAKAASRVKAPAKKAAKSRK